MKTQKGAKMATYVIGDIHGQLEQLKVLLEKMKFNENDELYVMGDVVDRGPDPIKALQYLMTLPNCVCIAGNHEWMALESLKLMLNEITEEFIQTLDENQVTILLDWLRNGGKTTMDQFCKLSKEERQEVLDFIGDFEAYVELKIQGQKYLLVHAGLNDFYYKKPIEEYTIDDLLVRLQLPDGDTKDLTMTQHWPIRTPRPTHHRFPASVPLVTGQRIIDTMFPIAKGGTAAIPGGFGTGKTMTQHQIAKWADADIIIYIGCGERGNEMTQVLEEFSELTDPRTGKPLMDRTTLIANTSNMPVAAREASIYTGLTLAEYYRDMGYDVAIMADSTSRWAEALRELSGRLEEMPAEEGFPAYLASRLSAFYERAGMMQTLNGAVGSVTIIGAVSPQGGDFSEPVTQNTKRFIRCFWGLDKSLAYARHYPAIHWLTSYSEYLPDLSAWYADNVSPKFVDYRNRLMNILNQENSLMEIVKLIGSDVLPDDQKLTLEIARVIRLGFLQQNAFHKDDTCVSLKKQFGMMDIILYLYKKCRELVARGMPMSVLKAEGIFEKVIAIKYDVPNGELQLLDMYKVDIDRFYDTVIEKNA